MKTLRTLLVARLGITLPALSFPSPGPVKRSAGGIRWFARELAGRDAQPMRVASYTIRPPPGGEAGGCGSSSSARARRSVEDNLPALDLAVRGQARQRSRSTTIAGADGPPHRDLRDLSGALGPGDAVAGQEARLAL